VPNSSGEALSEECLGPSHDTFRGYQLPSSRYSKGERLAGFDAARSSTQQGVRRKSTSARAYKRGGTEFDQRLLEGGPGVRNSLQLLFTLLKIYLLSLQFGQFSKPTIGWTLLILTLLRFSEGASLYSKFLLYF
jgi:hypothetical protein